MLVDLDRFRESVKRKKKLYGMTQAEAANATIEEMVRVEKKPICCILGDDAMAKLLQRCREASIDGGHA